MVYPPLLGLLGQVGGLVPVLPLRLNLGLSEQAGKLGGKAKQVEGVRGAQGRQQRHQPQGHIEPLHVAASFLGMQ